MHRPTPSYTMAAAVCAILLFVCFTRPGTLLVPATYTIVLLVCLHNAKETRFGLFDGLVLSLLLWEFVLGIVTPGRNNCMEYLEGQYVFTAYYFILRLILNNTIVVRRFLNISGIFVSLVAIISMVSFSIFRAHVYEAGFESLYDFKYLYRPLGGLNNVWSTLMLMFMGLMSIPLLIYEKKWKGIAIGIVSSFLVSASLMLSFSRGIYICLALVVLMTFGFVIFSDNRTCVKILKCAIVPLVISVTAFIYSGDVLRTARLMETESQQRSIEGRIDALDYTAMALDKRPLTGFGTGNYSLAVNEYAYENGNESFTNFAPNVISQLLLEKGIVGTILWGLIYLMEIIALFRCRFRNRRLQVLLFLLLTILIIREMTFASILTDRRHLAVLAILLAISQNNVIPNGKFFVVMEKKVGIVVSILIFSGICTYQYGFNRDRKAYEKYALAIENKDYFSAYRSLETAGNNVSTCLLASSSCLSIYKENNDSEYLVRAIDYMDRAIRLSPTDVRLLSFRSVLEFYLHGKDAAIASLKKLVTRFPDNTSYRMQLARLLYECGDKSGAVPHFSKAIISSPSILESVKWEEFVNKDNETADLIISGVKPIALQKPTDQILLSKYGKLLYLIGGYKVAEEYLEEAAAKLPNLKTPWEYLAKIKDTEENPELVRHLSLWNDDAKDNQGIQEKYDTDYSAYDTKSLIWYRYPLYHMTDFKLIIH